MTALLIAKATTWSARDVLAVLVIIVWGVYVVMRGDDYPNVSPLEWLGGLGLVLGAVSRFYAKPAPADTEGGF